ncbi:hypothetical protein ANTPLA_LOCUS650 [Anthophora plagiata]
MRTGIKSRTCKPRDNFGQSCVTQTNSTVRLCNGRDHIWMPLPLDPILTDVTSVNRRLPDKFSYSSKGPIENSQEIKHLVSLIMKNVFYIYEMI